MVDLVRNDTMLTSSEPSRTPTTAAAGTSRVKVRSCCTTHNAVEKHPSAHHLGRNRTQVTLQFVDVARFLACSAFKRLSPYLYLIIALETVDLNGAYRVQSCYAAVASALLISCA